MRGEERLLRVLRYSDVQIVVLAVEALAREVGMSTGPTASLATAVSELSTNVVKYARTGRVRIRAVQRRGQPGVEVVVEDNGPGIADLEESMKDHVSTGGTLGLGLPGARRLVDDFRIESQVGKGTRVEIVKWG
jgi:serine/threonine-protein kinase RsbT